MAVPAMSSTGEMPVGVIGLIGWISRIGRIG